MQALYRLYDCACEHGTISQTNPRIDRAAVLGEQLAKRLRIDIFIDIFIDMRIYM